MFNESTNLRDHATHDPSACDYARMLLIQSYVADTHEATIASLSTPQLLTIGLVCARDSTNPLLADMYSKQGLTLKQVYDFSEYVRHVLLTERNLLGILGMADLAEKARYN